MVSDLAQKSLEIKQDDKFFTRLLSKEGSMANPSFRVYYGGVCGAVPFMWESQPGTPKHNFSESTLPPLTPPPSYYNKKKPINYQKHSSRSNNLFHTLFPKRNNLKKALVISPPSPTSSSLISLSSSSSSLSSSWSPSNSPMSSSTTSTNSSGGFHKRSRYFSSASSFDCGADDEDQPTATVGSPTSTLCFGIRGGGGGCRSASVKAALLSIVGHGCN